MEGVYLGRVLWISYIGENNIDIAYQILHIKYCILGGKAKYILIIAMLAMLLLCYRYDIAMICRMRLWLGRQ